MKQNAMTKNKIRLPELLAPAGSFTHLKAAIKAGADAVYMGGQQFGARAYADNFTRENVLDALQYAHFYEKRLYLTVNTLMKEKEITGQLYDFLLPFYEAGLDGVIVQDLGAAAFIRRYFPEMEVHGSTQMTIVDVAGARAAARLGMNRIVPARELSLKEIRRIKEETGLEIEVFVHGALCYCYSGQCLLSSMYGGRSGNRGRCAQPCRLPYRILNADGTSAVFKKKNDRANASKTLAGGDHVLSPKDLSAVRMLPALIEAGVDSLKIEGRMKNVEYVAGVTAIYRKYLDLCRELTGEHPERFEVSPEDTFALEELYSRSGFTDGYWQRHNGSEMMSTVHPRNLGRKIGRVRKVTGRGQIVVKLCGECQLHPKDILILPLEGQEEMALTVPEKIRQEKEGILLNVSAARQLRAGMDVYRRKNAELSDWIENDILKRERKYPVTGVIAVAVGKPAKLSLCCRDEEITLYGREAETSDKRPVSKEDLCRQMNKTGQVPFYLEHLDIQLEENAFLPMSAIKELRQKGFAALQERLSMRQNRKSDSKEKKISLQSRGKSDTVISLNNKKNAQQRLAVVYDKEMLSYCLDQSFFDGICFPMDFWEVEELPRMAEEIIRRGKRAFLAFPQILRDERDNTAVTDMAALPFWSGIFVHTVGQAQLLYEQKERTASIHASASFYQWNHLSLRESTVLFGLAGAELPVELSAGECVQMLAGWQNDLKSEAQKEQRTEESQDVLFSCSVYGRVPVMRSAQCIKKTRGGCDHRQGVLFLEDSRKRRLPVVSHCAYCYNSIWTDRPRDLIGEEYGALFGSLDMVLFHFFLEKEEDAAAVIRRYRQWEKEGFRPVSGKTPDEHWKYGIE